MNTSEKVSNVIDISDVAKEELVRLDVNKEEFLRISLVPGGCSGLTYQMDTDTVVTHFDEVIYEDNKLKAVTDKNSLQHLKGLFIDYSKDLIDVGFRFSNPNAIRTCGCGHSATFE
jgi:iron-sulfur cluster assembly protein